MRQVSVKEYSEHPEEALASVEAGETVELVRNGKPVARLVPALPSLPVSKPSRDSKAWARLTEMMEKGLSDHVEPWTRDEIYEDRLKRFFP